MASKTVVVKKYENRRLYDTTNSRYVNLDEVAQLLQAGNEVQVIDAVSGEDITRLILTQIIVEDAKTPGLPHFHSIFSARWSSHPAGPPRKTPSNI